MDTARVLRRWRMPPRRASRRYRDRSPGKFDKGLKTVKKMNLEAEGKVAGLLILLLTWKIERAPNEPTP